MIKCFCLNIVFYIVLRQGSLKENQHNILLSYLHRLFSSLFLRYDISNANKIK